MSAEEAALLADLYDGKLDRLRRDLTARSYSDEETRRCIARVFRERGYILDPHSAVGYLALEPELEGTPGAAGILLATAHPAKFAEVVEPEIGEPVPVPETPDNVAAPATAIEVAAALQGESHVTRVAARAEEVKALIGGPRAPNLPLRSEP